MLKLNDASNFRRTALGLCLIAGPLVTIAGGLVTPWEESDKVASYLAAMAGSPIRAQVSAVLLYFGYLLIAVGIFGMMCLLKRRAVVLGHVAGVLAIWGWVTLPGLLSVDFYDLSLGQAANREEAIVISERAGEYPGAAVLDFPVLVGFLGLVLLCVALWRARFAPAWVPVVLVAGLVVTFVTPPAAVSFTIGFGLMFAALGYVGIGILRMSDEEWEQGTSLAPEPVVAEARPQAQ